MDWGRFIHEPVPIEDGLGFLIFQSRIGVGLLPGSAPFQCLKKDEFSYTIKKGV